jgi:hypothetical protein
MLAGFNAGIKAAGPSPLIEIGGNAGPLGNRANRNVTIKDELDFPMAIVAAAARKGGHSALYRHSTGRTLLVQENESFTRSIAGCDRFFILTQSFDRPPR